MTTCSSSLDCSSAQPNSWKSFPMYTTTLFLYETSFAGISNTLYAFISTLLHKCYAALSFFELPNSESAFFGRLRLQERHAFVNDFIGIAVIIMFPYYHYTISKAFQRVFSNFVCTPYIVYKMLSIGIYKLT